MAYTRITLAELSNRLQSRAGDGGVFWINAERVFAINEAVKLWQSYTGEHTTMFPVPLSSGEVFYNVPRQIISVQRVLWNGGELQLLSEHELDMSQPGWDSVTGTPTSWAPIGLNMIAITPAPTSGAIVFEGMQEAPILQSNGDFLDMGDEDLSRLLGYGTHYLSIKEGSGEMDATGAGIAALITAGAERNGGLKMLNMYKAALGLDKDRGEIPDTGKPSIGARLS